MKSLVPILFLNSPAIADVTSPTSWRDGSVTFYLDNDIFNGTDQYYTNGFRLAYLSDDRAMEELPLFHRYLAQTLPGSFSDHTQIKNYGFSLGQSLFTPADTTIATPQLDDRPFAGWLYLGTSVQTKTRYELDLLEINIGVIGPSALGQETQDTVHNIIGSELVQGWENQLQDEFAFNLYYQHKWRQKHLLGGRSHGWAISTHQSVGFSLGTVHTDLNAGAAIRLGYNLPNDFGSNRVSPTAYVQPAPRTTDPSNKGLGFYVFAGVDVFARAHNAFLDGGFFRDGQSTDSKPLVGELEAGIALTWDEWRVTLTQVFRSDEFEKQNTGGQNFGTLAVSYRF